MLGVLSCQLRGIAVLRLLFTQYAVFAAVIGAQLGCGALNGLLGPALRNLAAQAHLASDSMRAPAGMVSCRAGGLLVGALVHRGLLIELDQLGVLCAGAVGAGLCTVVLPPTDGPGQLASVLLLQGMFMALIQAGSAAEMTRRSIPEPRGRLLSQLAGGAGGGLGLAGLLALRAEESEGESAEERLRWELVRGFHTVFWLVGSLLCLLALVFTCLAVHAQLQPADKPQTEPKPVQGRPTAGACLSVLLQAGGEIGFGLALFSYSSWAGLATAQGVLLCGCFWLATAGGRALSWGMMEIYGRENLLVGSMVSGAGALTGLICWPQSQFVLWSAVPVFGLSVGGMAGPTQDRLPDLNSLLWLSSLGELLVAPCLCLLVGLGGTALLLGQMALLAGCALSLQAAGRPAAVEASEREALMSPMGGEESPSPISNPPSPDASSLLPDD